ncbi:MAG: PQQ-binding-like beta-propeller repeat protein [Chloroflexota bacterium]
MKRGLYLAAVATLTIAVFGTRPTVQAATSSYNWTQFNFDSHHSGNDPQEKVISPSTVSSLHRLFQVSLPAVADSTPVYLSNVSTSSGMRDLVYVTTTDGHIVALDAHTGAQIWSQQYGPGSCRINNNSGPCYTTSSPAISPGLRYVYSYGLDGYVHRYLVGSGTEMKGGGWPELATAKPYDEKGSSALSIAATGSGQFLYVANGGYPGDYGDYQGHITAINLSRGTQQVFNTLCSNQAVHFMETPATPDCPSKQSAVWARPGVIYDSTTGKLYFATGNGDFNPAVHDWGDSVLALKPNGTGVNGNPVDSYTPTDYQQLQNTDADLGSTAPAILPPYRTSPQHVAVQGGKDALLRLINLDTLSGQGGPGHTGGEIGSPISVPQGGEVLTQPAVWRNPANGSIWVFVANDQGISGIRVVISGGKPTLQPTWTVHTGGTSPIVANGVLFYASSGIIQALNPSTGAQLWHDTTIGGIHWESPIVDNGRLYITDGNGLLTVYGL